MILLPLNFLCKLVLLVNSASLFYLVSSRVSGMPRINSLYDPSVLVTKEILSGAEKSHLHWLSLLWRKCYVLLLQGIQNLRRPQINKLTACVAGAKRGGGGGGEKSYPLPLSKPATPPLFPFLPIPYPFRRLLRTQATSSNFYHFTYTTQDCNLAQILSDRHLKISNYTSSQIAGRKSRTQVQSRGRGKWFAWNLR